MFGASSYSAATYSGLSGAVAPAAYDLSADAAAFTYTGQDAFFDAINTVLINGVTAEGAVGNVLISISIEFTVNGVFATGVIGPRADAVIRMWRCIDPVGSANWQEITP